MTASSLDRIEDDYAPSNGVGVSFPLLRDIEASRELGLPPGLPEPADLGCGTAAFLRAVDFSLFNLTVLRWSSPVRNQR
jgi:hypothetical protein